MSGFIAGSGGTNIVDRDDVRLWDINLRHEALFADMWAIVPASFETPWWPRGGGFIGDAGSDVGMLEAVWWGEYYQQAGSSSRFGFVGVTRDSFGSALGGCTVLLFRTSDSLLIDSTTSDSSGNFLLNTAYYPDAHFLVVRKTGSPNVSGATDGTQVAT
jgi:hypothetical protein